MDTGTLLNIVLAIVIFVPILILIFIYKGLSPKYYGLLLFGIILIAWASVVAGSLYESKETLELLAKKSHEELKIIEKIKLNLEVWVYIVPAATLALGVNLITEFILKDKPDA